MYSLCTCHNADNCEWPFKHGPSLFMKSSIMVCCAENRSHVLLCNTLNGVFIYETV